jgi:hypothetical protein
MVAMAKRSRDSSEARFDAYVEALIGVTAMPTARRRCGIIARVC